MRIAKRRASSWAIPGRICKARRTGTIAALRDRFRGGYSVGFFIDQRENRRFVRASRAKEFAQLLRLHLLVFRGGGNSRREDSQHRSVEKIARARTRKFRSEFACRPTIIVSSPTMSWRSCRDWREREKSSTSLSSIRRHSRARIAERRFRSSRISKHCCWLRWRWPSGTRRILLSTNCSSLRERALEVMARYCLKATRRAGTFHQEPALPDFPPVTPERARFGSRFAVLNDIFGHANRPSAVRRLK